MQPALAIGFAAVVLVSSFIGLDAQRSDAFVESRDHPAIRYSSSPLDNRVETLNRQLASGAAKLVFNSANGYLLGTLEAFGLPVESQVLVFSETSFQASRFINVENPRAVFFDDTAYVGWVRGGNVLEVAVQDPQQGTVFYELLQDESRLPKFRRNGECLACHLSWDTFVVPGLLMHSTAPLANANSYALGFPTDHRSPFVQRWGGWFVTGNHGGTVHMGNVPVVPEDRELLMLASSTEPLASVEGLFDTSGFPSLHSDLVALMVLAHQTRMTNLITRAGWEARVAAAGARASNELPTRVRDAAHDLVDYMLFVDEAPFDAPVAGSSGFTELFSVLGPRDTKGRSLRDLDLERRLFRFRCSYMIYTPAFDALPTVALDAVYARLWSVLSGETAGKRYAVLTADERHAIIEILRDTKQNLPEYFQSFPA